jgi:thiol:disulfide interchange protein DsbG
MNVKHKIAVAITGAVALLAALGLAAQTQDYPAPIRAIMQHGVEIQAEFEAPGGLTGYVGQSQGQPLVLYVTADGEQAIVGPMLDARGRNLSEEHIDRFLPKPDLSAVWEQLEQADWVREGSAGAERVVYVFMDPECPFCNAFWRAARPYVGEEVQLRHIMVGILRPTSLPKAARILGAEDPAAALAEHEQSHASGGIEPLQPVPAELRERVEANNRLMQALGAHATPAIYYEDREGRVQQLMGMPRLGTIAEEIFQLPEQPPADPSLERFR